MKPSEMIEDLERRAQRLLDAAEILREEYGVEGGSERKPKPSSNGHSASSRSNRFNQLANYLKNHGPAPRKTILKETKIPIGTLATLMRRPEFKRDDEGNWSFTEKE